MNESQFRIVSTEYDGRLCHDAEWYLRGDLEKGDLALVNDTFLMKTTGRRVMIAFEMLEVDGGVIEPGYWYEPDWYVLRSTLYHKHGYESGRNFHIPGILDITRERSVREQTRGYPMNEVLQEAGVVARELSKLPVTEIEYPLPYPPHLYSKAWRGEL